MQNPLDQLIGWAFVSTLCCLGALIIVSMAIDQASHIEFALWTSGGFITGLEISNLLNLLAIWDTPHVALAVFISNVCCIVGIFIGSEKIFKKEMLTSQMLKKGPADRAH